MTLSPDEHVLAERIIRALVHRLLGSEFTPQDREDAAQEARLSVLIRRDAHDPTKGASLRTWFFRGARYSILAYRKRRRAELRVVPTAMLPWLVSSWRVDDDDEPSGLDRAASGLSLEDEVVLRSVFAHAVERLDDHARRIVEALAVGLGTPELADHLDVTPSSAASYASRARAQLREVLEEQGVAA